MYSPRLNLEREIRKLGGYTNTHCHLDRARTLTEDQYKNLPNITLKDKWAIVDQIKKDSSVGDIYDRMSYTINQQLEKGVTTIGSFIDVDSVIQDKAMKASDRIRTEYKDDCDILFINQVLKGVVDNNERAWFNEGCDFCDIIGGLPSVDGDNWALHMLTVLEAAKSRNKLAHIHVDQFNSPKEDETLSLTSFVEATEMQGRVHAVHCISLGAHEIEYRQAVYRDLEKCGIGVIACPTAWIDSPRTEVKTPTHNSVTPIDELFGYNINVSLGSDNIYDIMKPFSNGDMWTELRLIAEATRSYDLDKLARMASVNGRTALGIGDKK